MRQFQLIWINLVTKMKLYSNKLLSFEGELTEKNIEIGVIRDSDPKKAFKVLT